MATRGHAWRTHVEVSRKPLAKIEGRRRMSQSGLTIAWRGAPRLDAWVAYIVNGSSSAKAILAHRTCERIVKHLLERLHTMTKAQIPNLPHGKGPRYAPTRGTLLPRPALSN